jgi:uncharacterized OB-fold protein
MRHDEDRHNDQPSDRAIPPTIAAMSAVLTESRCIACGTVTFDARIPCHECARIQKRSAN